MKLIITRHGETVENEHNIMQGHGPGHLSAIGKKQAESLAERLEDQPIDAIYSSDLKRAHDTALIIAKYHQETPIILSEDLREVDLGPFTGKTNDLIDFDNRPDSVESRESVRNRVRKVLELIKKKQYKTVLLVSHNGTVLSAVRLLRNMDVNAKMPIIKPASYTAFEVNGEIRELAFNEA